MKRLVNILLTILAALTAFGLICAAYGGHIDPRVWALPAVASLAFVPTLLVAVVMTLGCALLRSWRAAAILAGALILTWPVTGVQAPVNLTSPTSKGKTFRLMTYNVSIFNDNGETLEYILTQDCDIVAIQEGSLCTLHYDQLPQHKHLIEELDRKYPYRSHGYHDLMLLSKWPYTVYADSTLRHGFGSLDDSSSEYHFYTKMFRIDVDGHEVRLLNVHLQSIGLKESDKQLYVDITRNNVQGGTGLRRARYSIISKLQSAARRRANEAELIRSVLDSIPAERTIVCGDFNDVATSFAHRTIAGADLRDAWADCGLGPTYTFHDHRMLFHIDHVLYGGRLRAIDINRHREGRSDHYPQIVTFELR